MKEDIEKLIRFYPVEHLSQLSSSSRTRQRIEEMAEISSSVSESQELQVKVRKFSDEAREVLEKQEFVIHELTGQSITSLREAGRNFWSTWHKDYSDLEALTSMQSEVAINPGQLFIPESNNQTLAEHEKMINRFSQEIGEEIPGIEAIMGEASDYVDLAFTHLDVTGEFLFGETNDFSYARTKTLTVGARVVLVGHFSLANGLRVDSWFQGIGGGGIFAAPLVVPA